MSKYQLDRLALYCHHLVYVVVVVVRILLNSNINLFANWNHTNVVWMFIRWVLQNLCFFFWSDVHKRSNRPKCVKKDVSLYMVNIICCSFAFDEDFLNVILKTISFRNMHNVICNYYCFWHRRGDLNSWTYFIFHPILICSPFAMNRNCYSISKRVPKGAQFLPILTMRTRSLAN
jgi:hypothetical protein